MGRKNVKDRHVGGDFPLPPSRGKVGMGVVSIPRQKVIIMGPGSIAIAIEIGIVIHPEMTPSFTSIGERPWASPSGFADFVECRFR